MMHGQTNIKFILINTSEDVLILTKIRNSNSR